MKLLCAVLTAGMSALCGAAFAATSSFGVVVLPDTQFYSRYSTSAEGNQFITRFGSEPYTAQTQWLAQNAHALGIPFVIHLGDVVDQQEKNAQWVVADAAMKVLETNAVPYSILAGNHDVTVGCGYFGSQTDCTDGQRDLTKEPFLKWFPTSRAQGNATFGGRDASGFHEYHTFEAQGQRYLVLSLSWRPSDPALAWARGVIQAHPTLPVIIASHDGLAIDSDATTALQTNYSNLLWDRLIKDNDQVFMVLNGHNHGAAHTTRMNQFGHPVEEFVTDYQMSYQGGNAYMRIYEFDLGANKIKSLSFSPWVPEKPQQTLNQFDTAVLANAQNDFAIDFNFAQRFGSFNPAFTVAAANREEPLVETVRALILENYTEPVAVTPQLPYDSEDFPRPAGTLAHWRFSGQAGTAVPDGGTVADLAGNNPLVRVPLQNGAQLSDAVWSDDHHLQSAASGSVCFTANSNQGVRESFFQTMIGAPLNDETLRDGYTFEAFVKFAPDWSAATNQWMSIMSRFGSRGNLQGFLGGWKGSPPLQFSVSNLREFQWEPTVFVGGQAWVWCADENGTCTFPGTATVQYGANDSYITKSVNGSIACTNTAFGRDPISGVAKQCAYLADQLYDSKTNWSGEIMTNTWTHVAIVNDPSTHDTTMYVEGAPVLRNIQNAVGIASFPNTPWTVGGEMAAAGSFNNGFRGCINEVRVSSQALPASQWLTARKNRVQGDGSNHVITGTDGDDLIVGNTGTDLITGGAGADTFVMRSMRDALDTITDFTPGEDKINLRGVLASIRYTGQRALADGYVVVVDSAAGAVIQIDSDGAAGAGVARTLVVLRGLKADQVRTPANFVF